MNKMASGLKKWETVEECLMDRPPRTFLKGKKILQMKLSSTYTYSDFIQAQKRATGYYDLQCIEHICNVT